MLFRSIGPSRLKYLELDAADKSSNAPTIVDFKKKDGSVINSLTLGKKHMKQGQESSPFGGGGGGWLPNCTPTLTEPLAQNSEPGGQFCAPADDAERTRESEMNDRAILFMGTIDSFRGAATRRCATARPSARWVEFPSSYAS